MQLLKRWTDDLTGRVASWSKLYKCRDCVSFDIAFGRGAETFDPSRAKTETEWLTTD